MATTVSHQSQHEFVRPPKSSRRNVTPPNSSSGGNKDSTGSISQSAKKAYNQAPDLGLAKSISDAYERAPDLGLQSTVYRVLGYDASGEGKEDENVGGNWNHQQEESSQNQKGEEDAILDPHEISKQRGPSNKDRIGKSQMEIGTEHGIPTRAGSGTTVSPDKTNKLALKKSHSSEKTKPRQAMVPEDYAPIPCPEKNAGTGKTDDIQNKLASQVGASNISSSSSSSNAENNNTKRLSQMSGNKTPTSTTSSNERKRRSFGLKMRDQIKGEMKIWSGTFTNNEEKIIQGMHIKHGDAA